MSKQPFNPISPILDFVGSLHLYSRWELAKDLGSKVVYGDGNYGDSNTLKKAKEDYLQRQKEYETFLAEQKDNAHPSTEELGDYDLPYGSSYIFKAGEEEITEQEAQQQIDQTPLSVEATIKPFSEFIGKDYLVDISPQSLFVMFPDITLVVNLKVVSEASWDLIRDMLRENGVLDHDLAFLKGDAISLDQLRKKIENETMTEGEISDLRKKLYGIAYVINATIEEQNKAYEK